MRKEITITIEDGRDAGKKFLIREMGAYQTEKWCARALLLLLGGEMPEGMDTSNMTALGNLATAGLSGLAKCDYAKVQPLLDDLLACCYFLPEKSSEQKLTPEYVDSVIDDVKTLFKLKTEAFKLHFDFFLNGDLVK